MLHPVFAYGRMPAALILSLCYRCA